MIMVLIIQIQDIQEKLTQKGFCPIFDIMPSDPMLSPPGIFHEKIIESDSLRVRFLFLDTRYFQQRNNILGKDQWSWLENKSLTEALT